MLATAALGAHTRRRHGAGGEGGGGSVRWDTWGNATHTHSSEALLPSRCAQQFGLLSSTPHVAVANLVISLHFSAPSWICTGKRQGKR